MKTRKTPRSFLILTVAMVAGIPFANAVPEKEQQAGDSASVPRGKQKGDATERAPGRIRPEVTARAVSPDGKLYAIYYRDGWDEVISIHEADTDKQLTKIVGHGDDVRALSFSADGRQLGSSSADKGFALWDVSTGKLKMRLPGVNDTDRWVGDLDKYGFRRKGSIHRWQERIGSGPARHSGRTEAEDGDKDQAVKIPWLEFSPDRLEKLRSAGKPVIVFCRADWDLNAKLVEKTVFADPRVTDAIKQQGYAPLRADFSRPSKEIDQFIRKIGGNLGWVNIIVFHGPAGEAPVVLTMKSGTDRITADELLDAMSPGPAGNADPEGAPKGTSADK